MSKQKKVTQISAKACAIVLACYLLLTLVFYWASGDQLYHNIKIEKSVTPTTCAAVMVDGYYVDFPLKPQTEYLDRIDLLIGTYARQNEGQILLQVFDENNTELGRVEMSTLDLKDYVYQKFTFDTPITNVKGRTLNVRVSTYGIPEGQAVSLWYGTGIDTGRFTVENAADEVFYSGGVQMAGKICYDMVGRNTLWLGQHYWMVVGAIGAMIIMYMTWNYICVNRGRETLVTTTMALNDRYSFLVRQLVARDFRRKYKRSALGVFWSFLNPLLTMLVQYLVFSTIFKSTVENFIVYLLSGIVLVNFFSEAVNLGLTSIVDNAHLINKVYMPKIIYPLSRVLSSVINLLISLLPLLLVMIITGVPFTRAMLLIPIGLFFLLVFCLGLALLLSTSMVFFRDTQFLWNVLSTLWMYLTPTFYPVDIIPQNWLPIYKLNPLYQYVTFLRSILLDGQAPSPELYMGCILSALIMLGIGLYAFKKNQNKFVLYL